MVVLGTVFASVPACGPPRRTRSAFEVLLTALPLSSATRQGAMFEYADARADEGSTAHLAPALAGPVRRVDHSLSDRSLWTAILGEVVPGDVRAGERRDGYVVDRAGGVLAGTGLLLVGPPSEIESAPSWLGDPRKSALGDAGLRDLARAVGEPSQVVVESAPPGCGPRWLATARREASVREEELSAWVLVYGGSDPARAAADDLPRVRDVVRARPPPGQVLQVDLRPRYIVVTYRGRTGDASSLCLV